MVYSERSCWITKLAQKDNCDLLISFFDDNRKISVMMGTLVYVFGSCERNSELTEKMLILLRPTPREDSSSLTFL